MTYFNGNIKCLKDIANVRVDVNFVHHTGEKKRDNKTYNKKV